MKTDVEKLQQSINQYARTSKKEGFWKALAVISFIILMVAILSKLS